MDAERCVATLLDTLGRASNSKFFYLGYGGTVDGSTWLMISKPSVKEVTQRSLARLKTACSTVIQEGHTRIIESKTETTSSSVSPRLKGANSVITTE